MVRWPWSKEEIYFEEKPKKPKETLASVSEKILIRRMKKQPDGFGTDVALRQKGLTDTKGTLKEQLKELKEFKELGVEFFGGGKEGKGGLIDSILNSKFAVRLADGMMTKMEQMAGQLPVPPPGQVFLTDSTGKVYQIPESQAKRLQEAPPEEKEPVTKQIPIKDLVYIFDLEPPAVIAELKSFNPTWIKFIAGQTYADLVKRLQEMPADEELKPYKEQLLSKERKEWVKSVINEAKKVVSP